MLSHTNKPVEQKIANIILFSEAYEHSLTAMNEKYTKCSQIIRKYRLNISQVNPILWQSFGFA